MPRPSFVVAESSAPEMKVIYVSRGFREQYGLRKEDCVGRHWLSWQCAPEMNQQELSKFTTRARDLTTAQLDRKGKYLFTYAKMEMRKVMFSPACSFVGCAWLVNTKANGDIFTCEQLSFSFQDGQGCQRYLLSQRDITRQVPVSHLLAIAGSGDYVKEVQARRQEASRRLSSDYLKAHVLPRLCTAAEKLGALSPSALTSATLGELPGMDLREVGCPKACLLPGLRAREKVIPASPTATLEDLPMFNLNEAVGFPEVRAPGWV